MPTEFLQATWERLLREAGASVAARLFSSREDRLDCVVTDGYPEPEDEQRVKKLNKPMVSTEWVIQSLILGKPVSYDGDPKYDWEHKKATTSDEIESSPHNKKKKKGRKPKTQIVFQRL